MKRNWEPSSSSSHSGQDESSWVHMPQHPYATAYQSIPNPFEPSPLSYEGSSRGDKRPRTSETNVGDGMNGSDGGSDDEEDDDEDDDENGGSGKGTPRAGKAAKGRGKDQPKVKLTRGSRACIACRKIKMRCIPDETSGPGGPCKRCKSGGHECIFEESNRGKRSTRKNEALAARVSKMEAALKGIGSALSNLDQQSLNSFSTALHGSISDPDIINVITSHTSPSAVPTLAVAMNRAPYNAASDAFGPSPHYDGEMRGEDSAHHIHQSQPPLSPRLHSLPDNVLSPLGLLAEASLQNTDGKKGGQFGKLGHRPRPLSMNGRALGGHRNGSSLSTNSYRMATSDVRGGDIEDAAVVETMGQGVASQDYFRPGATVAPYASQSDDRIPELLTITTREEIEDLFTIFFDHMGPHVPILYREFHTPELVLQRSQFLCTVICAIAARHYTKRNDLHARLSSYGKRLAFEVPSRGYKSVEVVQAYLLLSLWTLGPEKTFEQDRTWMMLGMAIRMATDLNLHRKSIMSGLDTEEGHARDLEIINRERCWLHCFILDRSLSAQMGKPYTLREDFIIRHACESTWHDQRFSLPSDKAMAAYVVLQQIMSRAIDSIYSSTTTISGLRQDCDYMVIVRSAYEELRRWLHDVTKAVDPSMGDYIIRAQYYFAYHSLVLYSFGLENAIERAKMDISFFLTNVFESAMRVCGMMKDELLPKGFIPYLPDTSFVMCSYALLSLLKLLKPELLPYHDSEEAIFRTVEETAEILENGAIDPSHQPAIYAAFIREIVRKTKEARLPDPGAEASSAQETSANGITLAGDQGVYDPQLLNENWSGDLMEGVQFAFVPQGGDMMILPSAAGPSESIQNSPQHHYAAPPANTSATPQATSQAGWAEYLPTFMSTDGFDGWDGSMLLPGFGRNQITLGGGLLHSQFGSGIITPTVRSPNQSRAASRMGSRAQTPAK